MAVGDGRWTAQVCRDSAVPVAEGAALRLRAAAPGLSLAAGMRASLWEQ